MVDTNINFWIDYRIKSETNCYVKTIGKQDLLYKNIYNSINFVDYFDYNSQQKRRNDLLIKDYGAISNLCFSQDGQLLFAGTDKSSLLMFDALNHQLISQFNDIHKGSVNYIKFLDSRIFATCSDDRNTALWDIRNLKSRLRLLKGHIHWVKNIEYEPNLKYLITSGFDGDVNIWDINKYSSEYIGSAFRSADDINRGLEPGFVRHSMNDCPYKKVLSLSCLMRMRITHDCSKMIICTAEGYMMIIHDLNLISMNEDLSEFQSDLYRLMQKGHSPGFDFGSWLNSLFCSKRNRVELISDFPQENEAHCINSLDVHPFDWCVISRNISRDENSEWTCVHNIQDYEKPNKMMFIETSKDNIYPSHTMFRSNSNRNSNENVLDLNVVNNFNLLQNRNYNQFMIENNYYNEIANYSENNNTNPNINDMHVSPVIIISTRNSNRRAQATLLNPNTSYRQIKPGTIPPKIFCNLPRLTNYIEELNVCKLYIKEVYFSPCGRVVCSPNNFGFRLLSFNKTCSEMSDFMYNSNHHKAQKLNEVKKYTNHQNYVTTVRFSPTHYLIASGCLSGKINFYQPVL